MEQARAAVQETIELNPHFSAKEFVNTLDYEDRATPERALATLLQFGLPECPKRPFQLIQAPKGNARPGGT